MAWTVEVTLDTDKGDVGNVSAVFTDTDATTFTFSQRIWATVANRDVFINAAIAARNAWRTRKTSEAGYKSNIESRFVTLDV